MTIKFEVRPGTPADAAGMAAVHVGTWRETYRGLMDDAELDDPGLVDWREQFWTVALTDPRYGANNVAVASSDEGLIGIAMSGPAPEEQREDAHQLFVLYVYAGFHGSGVGAALLDAVLSPSAPSLLWVADPNPRAQAFYRKNGFNADGAAKVEDGIREIRMVRNVPLPIACPTT